MVSFMQNMDDKYCHKLREDNHIIENSVAIFRHFNPPPFLPITSGNKVTPQVKTIFPTVKSDQKIVVDLNSSSCVCFCHFIHHNFDGSNDAKWT